MTFGEDWGWGSSQEESRKVYDAFLEAGGNFIDTANVYTNGTSENLWASS
jgi:aryl-alcohol dehydrogenase-like predicted oxidoreductase